MRRVLWIVLGAAGLWSAYWLAGALLVSRALPEAVTAQTRSDLEVQLGEVSVAGYPLRFESTVERLQVRQPATGLTVYLPRIGVEMPAWWPGQATLTFPTELAQIALAGAEVIVRAEAAQGQLKLKPSPALALQDLSAQGGPWDITQDATSLLSGDGFTATLSETDGPAATYGIALNATGLTPGDLIRNSLSIPTDWPRQFAAAEVAAQVTLSRALDRHAAETPPQPRRIEVETARVIWGDVEISLAGLLDIAPEGIPQGEITLLVDNWRRLYDIARSGAVALPQQADLMLNALSNIGGDPDTLDLVLSFDTGQMTLGGIALGPAPRLIVE